MRLKTLFAALAALLALVAAGCGGASDTKGGTGSAGASASGGAKLALVAYSTPQVVYDEVIPAFEKTTAGNGVGFSQSYGASGEQSRAVVAGLPADIVTFSLEPDVDRLVKAGLVAPDWASGPTKGFVSKSVVVFIVRKGNPKGIHTWQDLLKPGIKVVTPNPFTSGSAKWNLLAAYGKQHDLGYLRKLITQHVEVQPKSGRDALQTFASGTGDVLLSYENEAITAQKKGQAVDYVVPDQTILIENPIAVAAKTKNPQQAQAFVDYALSKPAQEVFASWGYRPVDQSVLKANAQKFPTPSGLFTIRDLGGWSKVDDSLFDPAKGAVAKIEQDAGVSTAK
jgi:sulfate transport system substrate-binding protein